MNIGHKALLLNLHVFAPLKTSEKMHPTSSLQLCEKKESVGSRSSVPASSITVIISLSPVMTSSLWERQVSAEDPGGSRDGSHQDRMDLSPGTPW